MNTKLDIVVHTPIGRYGAELLLNEENEKLSGVLSMMGHDHKFSGGTIKDGKITLKMAPKTPLGVVPFTAVGTFIDGKIFATAKTRLGVFKIQSK